MGLLVIVILVGQGVAADETTPVVGSAGKVVSAGHIVVSRQKYLVPTKYNEVPFFAAQVASGQLPPIEKRLPAEPFVEPFVRIEVCEPSS